MPLPLIRLKFVGFWDGFDTRENVFTRLLARGHRVEICDDPDFIIYSYIGRRRRDRF